jgi:heme-degrading monooxygenase HmoA
VILEIADIRIHPGSQAAFEAAVARGLAEVVAASPGFVRSALRRGIESPERYMLLIEWQRLEDHTVGFRQSEAFGRWRAIVGPYFAAPPAVEHFALAHDWPAP